VAHIPEGVVSTEVLMIGAVGSMLALSYGLKKLDNDKIPQTAMLAAVFFVCSMITFPVGPSSIHLIFNGLMGLMLGWAAVPAIFIALLLQLLFFGYGGVLVLGVNTFNIALPAIAVALILRPILQRQLDAHGEVSKRFALIIGGTAGAMGIGLTTLLLSTSIVLSGQEFAPMLKVILATNIPLLVIEASISAIIVSFLLRTSPSTFSLAAAAK
jgi:cobalt/nickel transport system permease protein